MLYCFLFLFIGYLTVHEQATTLVPKNALGTSGPVHTPHPDCPLWGRASYHVRLEVVVITVAVTPFPALQHLLFVFPIHLRVHGNGGISELVWGGQS